LPLPTTGRPFIERTESVNLRIPFDAALRYKSEMGLVSGGNVAENAQSRPRLVLADDHPDILVEVRQVLGHGFDVLCTVAGGKALVRAVRELRPDAVITDLQMPELGGIEAGTQILRQGLCSAVIALTMHNEPQLVGKTLRAGIRGYVLKLDAGEELIPAIRAVLGGGRYLSRGVSENWRE